MSVSGLLTRSGCREVVGGNRSQQQVVINDFSAPAKTRLSYHTNSPGKISIWVSGTIDKPVFLSVDQVSSKTSYPVRRDTLKAGTYTDWTVSQDFYGNEAQLTIAATPTGMLTVLWYTQ